MWPLVARPVTVDGVGDEYADAHDAEEHGDCFQHDNAPKRAAGQIRLHAAMYTTNYFRCRDIRKWRSALVRQAPAVSRLRPASAGRRDSPPVPSNVGQRFFAIFAVNKVEDERQHDQPPSSERKHCHPPSVSGCFRGVLKMASSVPPIVSSAPHP